MADKETTPALKRLPEISAQLQNSLTQANRLFGSLNKGYGDDSRFRRDLDRLLPQITDPARSIRALTDLLSRHPAAPTHARPTTGTGGPNPEDCSTDKARKQGK